MTLNEYLESQYSPTATKGYQNLIRQYTAFTYGAEKANYQQVINYIQHLRVIRNRTGSNLNPKTIRNHLFAVKIYYRYLVATGARNDHPCQHLYLKDAINRQVNLHNLYAAEELETFLETYKAGKKNKATQLREKALITLLIDQGLTVLEISQLDTQDIDLVKGTVDIKPNPKTNGRTLELKPRQILLMQTYMKQTRRQLQQKSEQPTDALFLSHSGDRIHPHDINRLINYGREKEQQMKPLRIRQSLIAHLLKAGNDLRVVQVFAGHKRISSTEAYQQSQLEELKAVVDQLHPLQ